MFLRHCLFILYFYLYITICDIIKSMLWYNIIFQNLILAYNLKASARHHWRIFQYFNEGYFLQWDINKAYSALTMLLFYLILNLTCCLWFADVVINFQFTGRPCLTRVRGENFRSWKSQFYIFLSWIKHFLCSHCNVVYVR